MSKAVSGAPVTAGPASSRDAREPPGKPQLCFPPCRSERPTQPVTGFGAVRPNDLDGSFSHRERERWEALAPRGQCALGECARVPLLCTHFTRNFVLRTLTQKRAGQARGQREGCCLRTPPPRSPSASDCQFPEAETTSSAFSLGPQHSVRDLPPSNAQQVLPQ